MLYLITLEDLFGKVGVVVRPMSEVVFFSVLCETSDDLPLVHFAVRSPSGQREHMVKMGQIVTEAALLEELKDYERWAEQDNEEKLERKEAKDGKAVSK